MPFFKNVGTFHLSPEYASPCIHLVQYSEALQERIYLVEVVNLASTEAMWVHFAMVAVHPLQLRITGYLRALDMNVIKICCCRQLQVDWQNIILCD